MKEREDRVGVNVVGEEWGMVRVYQPARGFEEEVMVIDVIGGECTGDRDV